MDNGMIKVLIKDIQGNSFDFEVNINAQVSSLIKKYK